MLISDLILGKNCPAHTPPGYVRTRFPIPLEASTAGEETDNPLAPKSKKRPLGCCIFAKICPAADHGVHGFE